MTGEGANELGILQNTPISLKKMNRKNNERILMRVLQKKKKPTDVKKKILSNKSARSTRNLTDNTLGGINILEQEFGDIKSHFESKIKKL